MNKEKIKSILLWLGKLLTILGGGAVGGAIFGLAATGMMCGYSNIFEMFN